MKDNFITDLDVTEVLKMISTLTAQQEKSAESDEEPLPEDTQEDVPEEEPVKQTWSREGLEEAQLREALLGEEAGLNVALYAKPEYNWMQMYEIRMGLSEHLNVKPYLNPLFRVEEMHEIRMGLLYGLDVSEYARLLYSVTDKHEIRMKRLEQAYREHPDILDRTVADESYGVNLQITDNGMQVWMCLRNDYKKTFTVNKLIRCLKENDVTYGIKRGEIEKLIKEVQIGEYRLVAEGIEPERGRDGYFQFFFDEKKPYPTINPDGTANYSEMQIADSVKVGQKLAVYYEALGGAEGRTVSDIAIPGIKGKEKDTLDGVGFKYIESQQSYYATQPGYVNYDVMQNKLTVMKIYEITGDANRYNANIQYEGTVHVQGSVGDDVHIYAKGDIIVNGSVEGAYLNAEQNIIIRGGVNAGGKGQIQAKGNVMAKFFESARVCAIGRVEANYFLNSVIECDEKIIARGKQAKIMGGHVRALMGIESAIIMNPNRLGMSVTVGDLRWLENRIGVCNETINTCDEQLRELEDGKRYLLTVSTSQELEGTEFYQKILQAVDQISADKQKAIRERDSLYQRMKMAEFPYLSVRKELGSDIVVTIGDVKKMVRTSMRGLFQKGNWKWDE